jgi:hypothetical protein
LECQLPLGQVLKARKMTLQFKPAAHMHRSVPAERDLTGACWRLSPRVLKFLDRDRKRRFVKCAPALAATIVIVLSLTTSAIAQKRPHAYSEYTYCLYGAFENGYVFSSTVGARNYQLENRYERLIYSRKPFAVRWLFDAVPMALVGDRCTRSGRRAYSCGVGGSHIGAQVNFVHFPACRAISRKRWRLSVFQPSNVWDHPAVQLHRSTRSPCAVVHINRRTAIDLRYKYHHISNANTGNQNPGLDSHMLFIGLSLFR